MNPAAISLLRSLDVDKALAVSPYQPTGGVKDNGAYADTRETALAGMHKARVKAWAHFTTEERTTSKTWLSSNGWRVPL